MSIRSLRYCIVEGVKNLFKNRLMTFATITSIMASLLIISIFYAVIANFDFMLGEFEKNIGIAIFFEEGTTEAQMLELKEVLEKREEVYKVEYIDGEVAWESFRVEYFQGREELLEGFGNDNPLVNSSSLQVLFQDITKQERLVELLNEQKIVRYVREAREVTDIVASANQFITYVSIALITILAVISIFMVSNTIRLAIALRKNEINIMRYMGAKTSMIRGPFVIEGVFIGLIASIAPIVLLKYFYVDITNLVTTQFTVLSDFLVFLPVQELLGIIMPLTISSGAILGFLGSTITISRYIKV